MFHAEQDYSRIFPLFAILILIISVLTNLDDDFMLDPKLDIYHWMILTLILSMVVYILEIYFRNYKLIAILFIAIFLYTIGDVFSHILFSSWYESN